MRREGLDAALSSYLGEREKEREREREESNVQGEPTPTDAYPVPQSLFHQLTGEGGALARVHDSELFPCEVK